MSTRLAALCLVLAAGPAALAQDPAAPPAPPAAGEAPAAAEPERREPQVDPDGKALLDRFRERLATPSDTAKSIRARGTAQLPAMFGGGEAKFGIRWKDGDEQIDMDVEFPEELTSQYPPQQLEMLTRDVTRRFSSLVTPLLTGPTPKLDDHDIALKADKRGERVDIVPCGEADEFERVKAYFDDRGLLVRMLLTPHVDPEDRMAAAMAGVEIPIELTYAPRGDQFALTALSLEDPALGPFRTEVTYWDGPSAPLPKELVIDAPIFGEKLVLAFFDWVLDDRPAAATQRAAETPKDEAPAAPLDGAGAAPPAPTEK